MGLVKALTGSAGGVMADQWKEYFAADSLNEDVLLSRGVKTTSRRSSNTKGSDNVISDGSAISVADGQCMILVDQGKVSEVCAEPGLFIYDSSSEPSLFFGNLGENLVKVFKEIGARFTFGGHAGKDQRIYYVNTKEIIGNRYGTATPIPFRVVDERAGIDIDIGMRCYGEYSYRVSDPITFYSKVVGNISGSYMRSRIDSQLKAELLTALQPAFSRIGEKGVRYTSLALHANDVCSELKDILSEKWGSLRGIEIVSFALSSAIPTDEDQKTIKEMQREAAYRDPSRGAARMLNAASDAMGKAAANSGGAALGFIGMNMASGASSGAIGSLYATASQREEKQKASPSSWTCSCGHVNTGNFCSEYGKKKPEDRYWTCSCGAKNKGKFCTECGKRKPAGAKAYKCDKCGWEPDDPSNPPKFCPECGDPFSDEDVKA